ncbi:MAG: tRNA adenosine(34) deaminase TadA [Hydrogenibacillus sp.]|nr:tRNA adenosine(34) deaminase TadA [Hydrogenibacillus sp.]
MSSQERTKRAQADLDVHWMRLALQEAEQALALGEVPIGAVVVKNGVVVGRGHNVRETMRDPLGHAELIALREAARTLGGWRLVGATLYVTLEPCPMCAGAVVQSRVQRLVYGASDPKAGCAGTLMNLVADPRFNHRAEISRGVLAEEAEALLKQFFARLREQKKANTGPS